MTAIPASFKDPSGKVFSDNGNIYRVIFKGGAVEYENARDSGIYNKLIDAGLLISHTETDEFSSAPDDAVYCLHHPRLPFISYPWEWPFSFLKDAGLIHLDAMEMLIEKGFWLRDANAFNVQYDGSRLRLIDTLSVGKIVPSSPWVAYGQFCAHFLAPLAMAAYCDIQTLSLWRNFIDGFPLDMAAKMLPFAKRYKPRLFIHLTLHSRFQNAADRKDDIGKTKSVKKPTVSQNALIGIVRSLRKTIAGIHWKSSSKIWEAYHDIRTYASDDISKKATFVDSVVSRLKPKTVWDLGANTGEFSLIAASHGAFVLSIDYDIACTERLYQNLSADAKLKNILPITMNLANPSPSLGWNNHERMSLNERGPADLVLALALIHHLVFSSCVPLSLVAEWFATISNHLIVEFVPPDDPMVEKLLMNRGDDHHPYTLEKFKSDFGLFFTMIEDISLPNGRKLFLCQNKNPK